MLDGFVPRDQACEYLLARQDLGVRASVVGLGLFAAVERARKTASRVEQIPFVGKDNSAVRQRAKNTPLPCLWRFYSGQDLDSTHIGLVKVPSVFEALAGMFFVPSFNAFTPRLSSTLVYETEHS